MEPWQEERLEIDLRAHIHSCPCCGRNWECNRLGCGKAPYCGLCEPFYYGEEDMRRAEAREDNPDAETDEI